MTSDDADTDDLATLLGACARRLAAAGEANAFLDWLAATGPRLMPALATAVSPRTGPVGDAFRALGVGIYNAMPQPALGYRPGKLRVPGRNEPCVCGSGRKYKQCCLALGDAFDLTQFNLLRFVLDAVPAAEFATLPATRADVHAVTDTARQWLEEGRDARAAALLEPWFAGDGPLGDALEGAFDELMDCYAELGDDAARERLVEGLIRRGSPALRAAAQMRKATILADRNDMPGAWAQFRAAQRSAPEDPNLGTLEVSLLAAEDRYAEAGERARDWARRLARRRDPDLARLIDFLDSVAADPRSVLARFQPAASGALQRLDDLAGDAPPALARYTFRDHGESGRELVPAPALAAVEADWRQVFPFAPPATPGLEPADGAMAPEASAWLDFLHDRPLAWDSFTVLEDLVRAVMAAVASDADEDLIERLLARAAALADQLDVQPRAPLTWHSPDNRAALRLLAEHAWRAFEDVPDAAEFAACVANAERLLALDPEDRHDLGEPLSIELVEQDDLDAVIALGERHPHTGCTVLLNRVLALVRRERAVEAAALLAAEAARCGTAVDMLLATRPREPEPGARVRGGREEAWYYRENCREFWLRDGALAWLRKTWPGLRAGR